MKAISQIREVIKTFSDTTFSMEAWRKITAQFHHDLPLHCEKDSQGYSFESEIVPVLQNALNQRERMEQCERTFLSLYNEIETSCHSLFHYKTDFTLLLYLELCNGAGWATRIDGQDVILLGIEKILELDWDDEVSLKNLIYHEIGHVWHHQFGNWFTTSSSAREEALNQLWQEGIAMRCEQLLFCQDNYYHQDKNGWLMECLAQEKILKQTFLSRCYHHQNVQDFFGDWTHFNGIRDGGYFLGCRFVQFLETTYSLSEIINLSLAQIWIEFQQFCQDSE